MIGEGIGEAGAHGACALGVAIGAFTRHGEATGLGASAIARSLSVWPVGSGVGVGVGVGAGTGT